MAVSNRSSGAATAAGVIVMVQSLLGLLSGLLILRFETHRRFYHPARVHPGHGLGLLVVLFSLAAFAIGFAVALHQTWARVLALALEVLLVVLALFTFPIHPGLKLLDVVAAVAVIALLLSDTSWDEA